MKTIPAYSYHTTTSYADLYTASPFKHGELDRFLGHVTGLIRQIKPQSPELTLGKIEAFFRAGGILIVATHHDTIVGMATITAVVKINSTSHRVEHVVVDSQHRGRGIGRELMSRIFHEAHRREWHRLDWNSEVSRAEAQKLYRSLPAVSVRQTVCFRAIL